jgi:DnaJ-class molecular chaperone
MAYDGPTFNQLARYYGADYLAAEWCLKPCPQCSGAGEVEPPHDIKQPAACSHCGGSGSVDTEPATDD